MYTKIPTLYWFYILKIPSIRVLEVFCHPSCSTTMIVGNFLSYSHKVIFRSSQWSLHYHSITDLDLESFAFLSIFCVWFINFAIPVINLLEQAQLLSYTKLRLQFVKHEQNCSFCSGTYLEGKILYKCIHKLSPILDDQSILRLTYKCSLSIWY